MAANSSCGCQLLIGQPTSQAARLSCELCQEKCVGSLLVIWFILLYPDNDFHSWLEVRCSPGICLCFHSTAGERRGDSDVECWSSDKRHKSECCPDWPLPVGLSACPCNRNCRHSFPQSALYLLLRQVYAVDWSRCSWSVTATITLVRELLLWHVCVLGWDETHVWLLQHLLTELHDSEWMLLITDWVA